ncbi:sensor histidine kinase [Mastigocoleus testarum]|uniref:histidine kinase n=1 Tax=Mastigocoleus testarum BC008 TaxID=371196 RepID=A0A0V7ZU24_9CYAN|nr:sensor histidine kinase [Mastigocoleus testarum]KST68164.1 histidine kinase [Mastigocoleus testarum BC008]KST68827.1 histidine kinase [Mastigocoleus testarum BC008]
MLSTASSEYVALCREQMALLAQGLGASLSIVYLTQELVEASSISEAKLVPIAVYPETGLWQQSDKNKVLPNLNQKLLTGVQELISVPQESKGGDEENCHSQEEYLFRGDQIVLPLVHENAIMGLFVTVRDDRGWKDSERDEIERIARTLAIACILDRRQAWLRSELEQQQILQEKQQDLLDNLLHQFRNPLTALRTFGKLLVKRLRPGDVNRDVATSIIRESDRLRELLVHFDEVINLTTADIVAPKLPGDKVLVKATVQQPSSDVPLLLPGAGEEGGECYLEDILDPLLISARAIAQERGLGLTAEIPANLSPVNANSKALTEVFSNIIDNALKYTPAGGKVAITVGHEKDGFQGIAISDNGPGISQMDLKHIGERGYRGAQAETEIPGTGLGLTIAKQLIEQMQGEIQIFSPALNSAIPLSDKPGTTFLIWLPSVGG